MLSQSSIRDNSRGTQFELPALCNAKWRRSESFCCIIAGAALWARQRRRRRWRRTSRNRSRSDREGEQTNFAGTAHNEATQQTNPSPSVDKKSVPEYGQVGVPSKVSVAKCEKNKTRRATSDERHSLLGIYISALPAATRKLFSFHLFYDYFSFIFH